MATFYSFPQFKCLATKTETIVKGILFCFEWPMHEQEDLELSRLSPRLLLGDCLGTSGKWMKLVDIVRITKYDFAHGLCSQSHNPFHCLEAMLYLAV